MDLTGLRRKYAVLVVLRSRREELEAVGRAGFSEEEGLARRDAFRVLAAEFPGALRELDATPAESLQARLDEIDAAVAAEAAPAPRWMVVTIDFHRTLRELLALKAWLATGGWDVAAWHEAWPHAHGVMCPDDLVVERVRRPPAGRLMRLVWDALARAHGGTADEIAALVLGRGVK